MTRMVFHLDLTADILRSKKIKVDNSKVLLKKWIQSKKLSKRKIGKDLVINRLEEKWFKIREELKSYRIFRI